MSNNFSWATGTQGVSNPVNSATDGTYLYVGNSDAGTISRILLSNNTVYTTNFITTGYGGNNLYGITTYGNYVYTGSINDSIGRWNISDGTSANSNWANLGIGNNGSHVMLLNDATYLYALANGNIYRFLLSNGTRTPSGPWYSGGVFAYAWCIYGPNMFFSTNGTNIVSLSLSNPTSTTNVLTSGLNTQYGMANNGVYIYATHQGGNAIDRYEISTNTLVTNWISSGLTSPCGITLLNSYYSNSYLYISNFGAGISQIQIGAGVPYPCFKRDTKILTNLGYIPIQKLRKGHLVKTLHDGYVPVYMMGKSVMQHNADKKRIKTQLYKCSPEKYPELTEDLIITGCHSILVENFKSEEEREKTAAVNHGNIYATDGLYRLPACVDTRASVYEIPGEYTIYHLALENEDYYMNYGIYANGLLVESCSKRFLKELSNMKIVSK